MRKNVLHETIVSPSTGRYIIFPSSRHCLFLHSTHTAHIRVWCWKWTAVRWMNIKENCTAHFSFPPKIDIEHKNESQFSIAIEASVRVSKVGKTNRKGGQNTNAIQDDWRRCDPSVYYSAIYEIGRSSSSYKVLIFFPACIFNTNYFHAHQPSMSMVNIIILSLEEYNSIGKSDSSNEQINNEKKEQVRRGQEKITSSAFRSLQTQMLPFLWWCQRLAVALTQRPGTHSNYLYLFGVWCVFLLALSIRAAVFLFVWISGVCAQFPLAFD